MGGCDKASLQVHSFTHSRSEMGCTAPGTDEHKIRGVVLQLLKKSATDY